MLDDLSPRMWEIVTLVIEERLTYDEVADRLELSIWTVKTYVTEIGRRAGDGMPGRVAPQKAMAMYYRRRQGSEEAA